MKLAKCVPLNAPVYKYVPRYAFEVRIPEFSVPRDVLEVRIQDSVQKVNPVDVAFDKAKKEAQATLDSQDISTLKEQCVEAILNQSAPMKKDESGYLDKSAAEDKFGRKAADFAFKKLVKSGQILATGYGRARRTAFS